MTLIVGDGDWMIRGVHFSCPFFLRLTVVYLTMDSCAVRGWPAILGFKPQSGLDSHRWCVHYPDHVLIFTVTGSPVHHLKTKCSRNLASRTCVSGEQTLYLAGHWSLLESGLDSHRQPCPSSQDQVQKESPPTHFLMSQSVKTLHVSLTTNYPEPAWTQPLQAGLLRQPATARIQHLPALFDLVVAAN